MATDHSRTQKQFVAFPEKLSFLSYETLDLKQGFDIFYKFDQMDIA